LSKVLSVLKVVLATVKFEARLSVWIVGVDVKLKYDRGDIDFHAEAEVLAHVYGVSIKGRLPKPSVGFYHRPVVEGV